MGNSEEKIVAITPSPLYAIKVGDYTKGKNPPGYVALGQVLMLTSWISFEWSRYSPDTNGIELLKQHGFGGNDQLVILRKKA